MRPREVFRLFACPSCARHWWTREHDHNPGHVCPNDQPSGGQEIALARELGHPESTGE